MLTSLVYYYVLLPTLPLAGEIGPTVVETCLNLSCGGTYCSGFLLVRRVDVGELGGGSETSGAVVQKFFNRSPITLKFEVEKIRERECQERERARARASKLLYLRSQVVVLH